jgi:hypothetical protein
MGDFNSASAKLLFAAFNKCDPKKRKTCKSDVEITEWLQNKFVVMMYNSKTFNVDKFGELKYKH